ncbi:MAG: glutathione S-transferase family protein [Geminicoccaceae bacterium]
MFDTARGEQRAPEYLAINPMAQVPALRLPDGTVITETGAMLMHLCDTHPGHGLLPVPGTAQRAVANRWLFWLATGLYESDLRYYYAERYTADAAGAAGVKAAALARMDRLLAMAEDLLGEGPFALGAEFSAVDLYLFMLSLWHPARFEVLDRHPKLAALLRAVRRRPAVDRIWADNHPPAESAWSTWTG